MMISKADDRNRSDVNGSEDWFSDSSTSDRRADPSLSALTYCAVKSTQMGQAC